MLFKGFLSFGILLWCTKFVLGEDFTSSYDWTAEHPTGDDLKITLGNVKDKIIVTLWLNNVYEQWEQNKKNQRVKGTVKNLIKRCHPHAVFIEVDVSNYNREAYTFEERAKFWGIDLRMLVEGPMIMPMYQTHGQMFWGSNQTQTITLTRALHKYLSEIETSVWKEDPPKDCDIELILKEQNEYNVYNPWRDYDHYAPQQLDEKHIQRLERENKKPKVSLREPEKALMGTTKR
jgi:hypothetical protein